MDRASSGPSRPRRPGASESVNPPLLPSRDFADEALRSALDGDEPGLFVLTGEAGSGKSRLWRGVASERAYPFLWIEVDAVPGDSSAAFHRRIGLALGIEAADRDACRAFLDDRDRDGERCVLVIEEAHNLTAELLEEVRALSGIQGLGMILLVGQTPLVRRLSTPAHRAFVSRVVGAAHLPPIDADEAQILLDEELPNHRFTQDEVERLHRDCWGEPRRLLKLARTRRPAPSFEVPPDHAPIPRSAPRRPMPPPEPRLDRPAPLLGESRPPLRVEEGLIEVGWTPELDEPEPVAATSSSSPRSEAIDAWNEWARGQGRGPTGDVATGLQERADVRAEPGRDFAGFGPHFGRRSTTEES